MFTLQKKRSYVFIGTFLLISMAATFIIVYYTYSSLLLKDFMNKQTFLAAQTTQAFKDQLLFLDEQTHMYINKNQLHEKLENKSYSSLDSLNFDSSDFVRLDIYSKDKLISSLKNITYPYSSDSLSISEIKKYTDKNSVFGIYDSEKTDVQVLICVKPITKNSEISGYTVFWINPDTINNILSLENSYAPKGKTMFSNYTSAALCIYDKTYICGKNPPAHLFFSPVHKRAEKLNAATHGNTYTFYLETELQDMFLFLEGDMSVYGNYFSIIKRTLFFAYLLISFLIISSLYLFSSETSAVVSKLYDKMMLNDTGRTQK